MGQGAEENSVRRPAQQMRPPLLPAAGQSRNRKVKTEVRVRKVRVGTTIPRTLLRDFIFQKGPWGPRPGTASLLESEKGGASQAVEVVSEWVGWSGVS